ncbi:hypothetical protein N9850_01550 [Granulosicoccus sp.]|nr:hypothetical protein [Granulosicoccus sp.]
MSSSVYDRAFRTRGVRIVENVQKRETFSLLERAQWIDTLPSEKRRALFERELRSTLVMAAKSPLYSAFVQGENLASNTSCPWEMLSRVPVLTKSRLREEGGNHVLQPVNRKPGFVVTSGSTGEPLKTPVDGYLQSYGMTGMLYGRSWFGLDPGARAFNVWGHGNGLGQGLRKSVYLIKGRIKDAVMNRIVFPAYDLSDQNLHQLVSRLMLWGPDYLLGYSSSIATVASYVLQEGIKLPKMKAVLVTGEMLFDHQIPMLESAFNCPIISEYGLSEVTVLGYGVAGKPIRILDNYCVLEILNQKDQPVLLGEEGRIVVTILGLHDVPIVRYDTGDRATELQSHWRGEIVRSIGPIQGRGYDVIQGTKGSISGVIFTHALKVIAEIERYQIVQNEVGRVEILLQTRRDIENSILTEVARKIYDATDHSVEVAFRQVRRILVEPSGKFRWIKSHVR